MSGADFCKFSHTLRHGLLLSGHILQISPGKNDNLPLVTATSTVWGSGSIGLPLALQSRPPQVSLICGFCPSAREFSLRWTFQPPQSGFLQIPSHDGHPCLWLTVPATEPVVDFHHQVIAHAGRTAQQAAGLTTGCSFLYYRELAAQKAVNWLWRIPFSVVTGLGSFRGIGGMPGMDMGIRAEVVSMSWLASPAT